jgi:hypothetical protein
MVLQTGSETPVFVSKQLENSRAAFRAKKGDPDAAVVYGS